jgi:sec1 family domain-containing protein 1
LANIQRIAEDLEKSLYESFHLNFVEPLPRSLLEELAAAVAKDGTGELVEQVCYISSVRFAPTKSRFLRQVLDQYLSFIAPSPSLFALIPPPPSDASPSTPLTSKPTIPHSSYVILNSPSSAEQQIEDEIERIASGLFNAVVTMGELQGMSIERDQH